MPNFGVPSSKRSTKVEKYSTPVATTVIAEEKKARSIMFNEAAVNALGLGEEAKVAFSFENGIFVFNGDDPNIPEEVKINVTKLEPRKISDKRTYEYLLKSLELTDAQENEFDLIPTTVDGLAALKFELKTGAAPQSDGGDGVFGNNMANVENTTANDFDGEEDTYSSNGNEANFDEFAEMDSEPKTENVIVE